MKSKSYIWAFLVTAALFCVVFTAGGLFPFGKETLVWCDMRQQAIPLLCDFKDILAGKSGFFLNMKNASGINFYGVFFFFISNPFSFLSVFVDKADIPYLMNVLVAVKLSLAAATAAWSFKKIFPESFTALQTVLGVCYGLCGYGMLFYQNIMWLDVMYVFPFVAFGIYNLIKNGKPLVLTVSLAVCVVLNYYISFMIFLFVILFFGFFALFSGNGSKKIYLDLGFCGVLSLLMSAVVWLPSLMQYVTSGRKTNLIAGLTNCDFFADVDTTLPILLCTGIIFAGLVFAVLSLLKKQNDPKKTGLLCVVFAAVCLPLIIEPVNMMWHTGSYMAFPARYGFIPVFAGLAVCANELSNIKFCEKSNKWVTSVLAVTVLVAIAFLLLFTHKYIGIMSAYVYTLWGTDDSLKCGLLLAFVAAMTYFCIILSAKKSAVSRRTFALLLSVVVLAEGACSSYVYIISATKKFDMKNYQNFLALEEQVDDDEFFRLNTEYKTIDANMTGAAGFNSISHYTSLNGLESMTAAKRLGYSSYWMETGNWGGTLISDALLSVKYTAGVKNGEYHLTENPYFLRLGIKCDGEIDEELLDKDRIVSLGETFARFTGSENAVTSYSPETVENCEFYTQDGLYFIENTTGESGTVNYNIYVDGAKTLYVDCYNGFSNRLNEMINKSLQVTVNGNVFSSSYPTQNYNAPLKIGSFKGEWVNITLRAIEDIKCRSFGVFGIDEDILKTATEKIETLGLNVSGNKISGEIKTAGKYFISIPNSNGYTVRLNGKDIEYSKALTGYIAVDTGDETGLLTISYKPPLFIAGCIISVLGLALCILYFTVLRKKLNGITAVNATVFILFLIVFAAVLGLVYIIPTTLNILHRITQPI